MSKIPSIEMIPSAFKSGKVYSVLPSDGSGDFDFSRPTTATRVNEDGLIEKVGSNVPRIDYTDGGCPKLLLEPLSTNLITHSEDFTDASWLKISGATIDSNIALSPKGDLTADRLNFDNISGSRTEFSLLSQPSGDYSFTFYAKTETGTRQIQFRTGISGSSFNTVTVTTEWQRFSITQNLSATGNLFPQVRVNDTIGGSILIWGAQLEQQSYATSYIPTNGGTVTREAETCNGAGDANTFNDSEGVLFAEISALADDGTYRAISISDSSYSNRCVLRYGGASNRLNVLIQSNGSTVFDDNSTSLNILNYNKIVLKYKQNDFSFWINGFEVATNTSGNTPSGLSQLQFADAINSGTFLYGKTKQIQYFDSALNDTDLEELTSWKSFSEMARDLLYTIQ